MYKIAKLAVIAAFATAGLTLDAGGSYGAEVLKSGKFSGRGGHKSSGGVRIVKDGNVRKVVFLNSFWLDGAPDPRVAFGRNGYVRGTIFAKLRKKRGAQEYQIPPVTDISKYNEVWIWCKKFNSPIARARMSGSGS